MWEADQDTTELAKSYEDLLTKVKDDSRRRKLDSSIKEEMQHGGDAIDAGAVGRWFLSEDAGGDTTRETVCTASDSKARARARGKEIVQIADRLDATHPLPVKGQEQEQGGPKRILRVRRINSVGKEKLNTISQGGYESAKRNRN